MTLQSDRRCCTVPFGTASRAYLYRLLLNNLTIADHSEHMKVGHRDMKKFDEIDTAQTIKIGFDYTSVLISALFFDAIFLFGLFYVFSRFQDIEDERKWLFVFCMPIIIYLVILHSRWLLTPPRQPVVTFSSEGFYDSRAMKYWVSWQAINAIRLRPKRWGGPWVILEIEPTIQQRRNISWRFFMSNFINRLKGRRVAEIWIDVSIIFIRTETLHPLMLAYWRRYGVKSMEQTLHDPTSSCL